MTRSRLCLSVLLSAFCGLSTTAAAGPQAAAGSSHAVVLTDNGIVWAWGSNSSGQIGDGTTTTRTVPVTVSISGAIAIAAGNNTTYVLKSDGKVWAWGSNSAGQIGDG